MPEHCHCIETLQLIEIDSFINRNRISLLLKTVPKDIVSRIIICAQVKAQVGDAIIIHRGGRDSQHPVVLPDIDQEIIRLSFQDIPLHRISIRKDFNLLINCYLKRISEIISIVKVGVNYQGYQNHTFFCTLRKISLFDYHTLLVLKKGLGI